MGRVAARHFGSFTLALAFALSAVPLAGAGSASRYTEETHETFGGAKESIVSACRSGSTPSGRQREALPRLTTPARRDAERYRPLDPATLFHPDEHSRFNRVGAPKIE